MLGRTVASHRNERNVHLRLARGRKLVLCFFGRFIKTLERKRVLRDIKSALLLKLLAEVLHDLLVDVASAHVAVAVGCFHLNDVVAHFKHRNVECSSAEVEDDNLLVLLLIKSVGKRRCRRLVYDALHIKARDLSRCLCSGALSVVKVCGDGNDRLGDFLAKLSLGIRFEL